MQTNYKNLNCQGYHLISLYLISDIFKLQHSYKLINTTSIYLHYSKFYQNSKQLAKNKIHIAKKHKS